MARRPGDEYAPCSGPQPRHAHRAASEEPTLLTREAVRRLDAEAIERFGLPGIVLMESAGRAVADEVASCARESGRRQVQIWCGIGNNGGDGYVAARWLHNRGFDVHLIPLGEPRAESDAARHRDVAERMGILRRDPADAPPTAASVVVDAIFGTGLDRPPSGEALAAIKHINAGRADGAPVVAVDVPSGLDADRGIPLGTAVRATCTVTFVAAKPGLITVTAESHVGRLIVADIGTPRELLDRLGLPRAPRRGIDAAPR